MQALEKGRAGGNGKGVFFWKGVLKGEESPDGEKKFF